MYKTLPQSVSRWRIVGTLTTTSPLHIGDGERSKIAKRDCVLNDESIKKADPEFATVFVDNTQKPLIPGTSLKGSLRAWALAHGIPAEEVESVFGTMKSGAAITFHDATFQDIRNPWNVAVRCWSPRRCTALAPQVVINPSTRSAEEGLLYYVEYVPAGAVFALEFTAQNATEKQRGLLLYVLAKAFCSPLRPATLGSEIANGWGKAQWTIGDVSVMERRDIETWLRTAAPGSWKSSMRKLDGADRRDWLAVADQFTSSRTDTTVRLNLTLRFDGSMVVNDPTQRLQNSNNDSIGYATVCAEDGTPILPAHSVRGALRAQARRIWQTLVWGNPDEDLNRTQNQLVRKDQLELAAFCRMFGATGWRAPIEIDSFRLQLGAPTVPQEFVAVDRFTGGAAHQKKFKANALIRPTFCGDLLIRVDRWESAQVGAWAWLLLAYTLRDWMEGDGAIGFGASKGYGAFHTAVTVSGDAPQVRVLRGILERSPEALNGPELAQWEDSLKQIIGPKRARA